ncbi:hypothetical protein PENSUB_8573 [Penicillium subrubescens]|uniref:Uncharacterized protein n=1 Tax=Penicillium subrubescens TaxID=1316194 RepID=A0A1Q5TG32_9EURO|nr:hypothetical protein PENSUB_8573 [Penicillium subrubescens]
MSGEWKGLYQGALGTGDVLRCLGMAMHYQEKTTGACKEKGANIAQDSTVTGHADAAIAPVPTSNCLNDIMPVLCILSFHHASLAIAMRRATSVDVNNGIFPRATSL